MVKLNLFCGTILLEGAINIDIVPPCDRQIDLAKEGLSSFDECSVDTVTCYHGLEHICHREVRPFLFSVARALKDDGWLVITTPDPIAILNKMMDAKEEDVCTLENLIFGTRETEYQVHRWLYTKTSLYGLLHAFFLDVEISSNPDDHGGPGLQAVCRNPRRLG